VFLKEEENPRRWMMPLLPLILKRERETEREKYEESPLRGSSLLRRSRDGDVVIRYNGEKKRINVVLSSHPTRVL
jgi:hypothetical protein